MTQKVLRITIRPREGVEDNFWKSHPTAREITNYLHEKFPHGWVTLEGFQDIKELRDEEKEV